LTISSNEFSVGQRQTRPRRGLGRRMKLQVSDPSMIWYANRQHRRAASRRTGRIAHEHVVLSGVLNPDRGKGENGIGSSSEWLAIELPLVVHRQRAGSARGK
jgi:hypothetical protein